MNSHRRHAVVLVAMMGIVALLAQLAGVSGRSATPAKPTGRTLAVVPGGAVPDIASTRLAGARLRVNEGETIRMASTATLRLQKAGRGATQVVCGIRYSRDGDPSWTLGTPYETVTVPRRRATTVRISRSFVAPATDTYRMDTSCHVSAPERGARVRATGTIKPRLGLPSGAATPVE